jgi:hypothetical protein
VRGDAPLGGFGEVLPQVEPVGDLDRAGCAGAGPVGVGAGAVPADHLHPRVGGQPVRQRPGVAAGQQVQRCAGLAVDQHGAIVLAAADREVIDAEHPRDARRRVRGGHDQPQQHLPARRHAQRRRQPAPGPPGQRHRDVPLHPGQQRGLALIPGGQPGHLLSERPLPARRRVAKQPPDLQPDHHPTAAGRGISQPPLIPAMHPPREPATRRARHLAGRGTGPDAQ